MANGSWLAGWLAIDDDEDAFSSRLGFVGWWRLMLSGVGVENGVGDVNGVACGACDDGDDDDDGVDDDGVGDVDDDDVFCDCVCACYQRNEGDGDSCNSLQEADVVPWWGYRLRYYCCSACTCSLAFSPCLSAPYPSVPMTEASCWYHLASLRSLTLDASGSVPSLPLCVASDATLHLVAMWIVVVQCLSFLFVLYGFVLFFFPFFPPLSSSGKSIGKQEERGD